LGSSTRARERGEHALFRELLKCFTEGDVMLADSYYCSYFLIAAGGQAKAPTFPAIADHSPKSARTSSYTDVLRGFALNLAIPLTDELPFQNAAPE
jgi:hypothetical protein